MSAPPRWSATTLCVSDAGATKFQRQFDVMPGIMDVEDFRRECTALHRRLYGEWPRTKPRCEIKNPQGQVVQTPGQPLQAGAIPLEQA